jgi:hypothetical protein
MPFSRSQQGIYRSLVDGAWSSHCASAAGDPADRLAKDSWTRDQLQVATGRRSTTDLDGGADFDDACAHFERIGDLGIHWQIAQLAGRLKRLKFVARRANPAWLRQFHSDADLQSYCLGIARQAGFGDRDLAALDRDQLRVVTRAVLIAANRARLVSS